MIMVDDDMVGAHRGKREISEISDVIGVNMEKRIRKTFARRTEKERKGKKSNKKRCGTVFVEYGLLDPLFSRVSAHTLAKIDGF
jgi:hypothetical protein